MKNGNRMINFWNHTYRPIFIMAMVMGLLTGCTAIFQDLDNKLSRKRFGSDYQVFETGLAIYDAGDYEKARDLFKTLSRDTASNKIARKAWLGEICCQVMLARTDAEYAAARRMLSNYVKSITEHIDVSDLVLFDPMIVRFMSQGSAPPPKSNVQVEVVEDPPDPSPEAKPPDDQHQVRTTQSELKKKTDRIKQLQRQRDDLKAENQSLKEKIKALETIDQKIKKKKTEISTPTE